MPQLTDIRTAIKTLLKTLKTANGYSTNLPDDHIYDVFDPDKVADKDDTTYPKAFLVSDDGTYQKMPANRIRRQNNYSLIVIVKTLATGLAASEKIELLIEDVEDLLLSDDTLGNLVQDISLTRFITDSGYAAPEGAAVFKIKVDFFEQR